MARRFWTEEEDETLREMVFDGSTCTEIGKELGRGHDSVYRRVKKLGLKLRCTMGSGVIKEDARALTIDLVCKGYTTRQIAKVRGVARKTVWVMLQWLVRDKVLRKIPCEGRRKTRYEPVHHWREAD